MELNVPRPSRTYESIIIMHPDASEAEQKQLFQKNAEIIKKFSGEVTNVDTWGKRKLGNPINKLRMGVYFHSMFNVGAECISELERTMKINDRVLRFLHSRMDDRKNATKHLEEFREALAASAEREKEREAKAQARRSGPPSRRPMKPRD